MSGRDACQNRRRRGLREATAAVLVAVAVAATSLLAGCGGDDVGTFGRLDCQPAQAVVTRRLLGATAPGVEIDALGLRITAGLPPLPDGFAKDDQGFFLAASATDANGARVTARFLVDLESRRTSHGLFLALDNATRSITPKLVSENTGRVSDDYLNRLRASQAYADNLECEQIAARGTNTPKH